MSYKKLVIKSTAAIEIEEVIAYYTKINKNLAIKLEKEIPTARISHHIDSAELYSVPTK